MMTGAHFWESPSKIPIIGTHLGFRSRGETTFQGSWALHVRHGSRKDMFVQKTCDGMNTLSFMFPEPIQPLFFF